jgi:hypothetical protein
MLFTFIWDKKEKWFTIRDENEKFKLGVGENILGQVEGEEDKEQVINVIWKLRPDLKWRP